MKILLSYLIISVSSFCGSFTNDANGIVGDWLTQNRNSVISIYESGGKYFGRISWIEENIDPETGKPFLDKLNPDKTKRSTPILNLLVMKNFSYDVTGKSYRGYMELVSKDIIKLRGYVGFSLLGQTGYWTRLKNN